MPVTKKPAQKPKPKKVSTVTRKNNTKTSGLSFMAGKSRLILFVLMFAAIGSFMLYRSYAATNTGNRQPPRPFVDEPERGLIWAGLKSPQAASVCERLLEVVEPNGKVGGCTHGPDPAPEGVNIKESVKPVRTGEDDQTAAGTGDGSTIEAAATSGVPCEGDGISGNRVQFIYARASDRVDRYATYAGSFQTWAGNVNNSFVESGLQTGEPRSMRAVTDASCNVIVDNVTLSTTGDDTFGTMKSELMSKGYNRTDRKYVVWMDANVYCGIGNIYLDDKPTQDNLNNGGNTGAIFARTDSGCWGLSNPVEAHELMHTLGGVQPTAPNGTSKAHCTDESDRMCYSDGSGEAMTYPCASTQERLFDCNNDDYFYAGTPPAGNYLATKWNTANSSFLFKGSATTTPTAQCGNGLDDDADGKVDYPADPGCSSLTDTSESPDPTSPPPADTAAPSVSISAPVSGATIGNKVAISATGSDNVAVVKMEVYIDGVFKTSSASSSVSYGWNSRRASSGAHTITVKAYDSAGNLGQSSITVNK